MNATQVAIQARVSITSMSENKLLKADESRQQMQQDLLSYVKGVMHTSKHSEHISATSSGQQCEVMSSRL
jgi:hypothetical protein